MTYEKLRARVEAQGLFRKRYAPYGMLSALVVLGVCASVAIMLAAPGSLMIQVLNGIFLAFVLVQAGMLGHDFSHRQVFHSDPLNRACAVVMWSLVCGLSERGWYEKHNAHHKHVNHVGLDPDLDIPFVFADVQHEHKPPLVQKYIVPHQHWLFFVLLPLVYPNFVLWSVRNVLTKRDARSFIEALLLAVHFVLFFGVPYILIGFTGMVLYCTIAALFGGLYMSLVFAPNHKGEAVVEGVETTWKDQILLTRNLTHNTARFLFFGGLDLQIEHHLFPMMSRFNYPRTQKIVKQFCEEEGIRYHETTWWGSTVEIYRALRQESLRRRF